MSSMSINIYVNIFNNYYVSDINAGIVSSIKELSGTECTENAIQ